MALTHDFILMSINENWKDKSPAHQQIRISDDIIQELNNYINWVEFKRADGEKQLGLDYHGISEICKEELNYFATVLSSLQFLFFNAPEQFSFKGDYDIENNKYSEIEFEKEDFLTSLNALLSIVKIAKEQNKKIVHIGI